MSFPHSGPWREREGATEELTVQPQILHVRSIFLKVAAITIGDTLHCPLVATKWILTSNHAGLFLLPHSPSPSCLLVNTRSQTAALQRPTTWLSLRLQTVSHCKQHHAVADAQAPVNNLYEQLTRRVHGFRRLLATAKRSGPVGKSDSAT